MASPASPSSASQKGNEQALLWEKRRKVLQLRMGAVTDESTGVNDDKTYRMLKEVKLWAVDEILWWTSVGTPVAKMEHFARLRKRLKRKDFTPMKNQFVLTDLSPEEQEEYDLRFQGDSSWLSQGNVQYRNALKRDREILDILASWWGKLPKDLGDPDTINEHVYKWMASKIFWTLFPNTTMKDCVSTVNDDWEFDSQGSPLMGFERFSEAIFDMVDVWCADLKKASYVQFLNECERIVTADVDYVPPAVKLPATSPPLQRKNTAAIRLSRRFARRARKSVARLFEAVEEPSATLNTPPDSSPVSALVQAANTTGFGFSDAINKLIVSEGTSSMRERKNSLDLEGSFSFARSTKSERGQKLLPLPARERPHTRTFELMDDEEREEHLRAFGGSILVMVARWLGRARRAIRRRRDEALKKELEDDGAFTASKSMRALEEMGKGSAVLEALQVAAVDDDEFDYLRRRSSRKSSRQLSLPDVDTPLSLSAIAVEPPSQPSTPLTTYKPSPEKLKHLADAYKLILEKRKKNNEKRSRKDRLSVTSELPSWGSLVIPSSNSFLSVDDGGFSRSSSLSSGSVVQDAKPSRAKRRGTRETSEEVPQAPQAPLPDSPSVSPAAVGPAREQQFTFEVPSIQVTPSRATLSQVSQPEPLVTLSHASAEREFITVDITPASPRPDPAAPAAPALNPQDLPMPAHVQLHFEVSVSPGAVPSGPVAVAAQGKPETQREPHSTAAVDTPPRGARADSRKNLALPPPVVPTPPAPADVTRSGSQAADLQGDGEWSESEASSGSGEASPFTDTADLFGTASQPSLPRAGHSKRTLSVGRLVATTGVVVGKARKGRIQRQRCIRIFKIAIRFICWLAGQWARTRNKFQDATRAKVKRKNTLRFQGNVSHIATEEKTKELLDRAKRLRAQVKDPKAAPKSTPPAAAARCFDIVLPPAATLGGESPEAYATGPEPSAAQLPEELSNVGKEELGAIIDEAVKQGIVKLFADAGKERVLEELRMGDWAMLRRWAMSLVRGRPAAPAPSSGTTPELGNEVLNGGEDGSAVTDPTSAPSGLPAIERDDRRMGARFSVAPEGDLAEESVLPATYNSPKKRKSVALQPLTSDVGKIIIMTATGKGRELSESSLSAELVRKRLSHVAVRKISTDQVVSFVVVFAEGRKARELYQSCIHRGVNEGLPVLGTVMAVRKATALDRAELRRHCILSDSGGDSQSEVPSRDGRTSLTSVDKPRSTSCTATDAGSTSETATDTLPSFVKLKERRKSSTTAAIDQEAVINAMLQRTNQGLPEELQENEPRRATYQTATRSKGSLRPTSGMGSNLRTYNYRHVDAAPSTDLNMTAEVLRDWTGDSSNVELKSYLEQVGTFQMLQPWLSSLPLLKEKSYSGKENELAALIRSLEFAKVESIRFVKKYLPVPKLLKDSDSVISDKDYEARKFKYQPNEEPLCLAGRQCGDREYNKVFVLFNKPNEEWGFPDKPIPLAVDDQDN